MGNVVRVDVNSATGEAVIDDGRPKNVNLGDSAPVSEPIVKIGGERRRFVFDTDGGSIREEQVVHGKINFAPAANGPLDGGRSPEGRPLAHSELTETSIIKHAIFGGEVRVKEAVSLGWLRKTADGYVLAGEMAGKDSASPAEAKGHQPDQRQQQDQQDQEPSIDAAGVPGTSPAVDAFMRGMRRDAGESTVSGTLVGILQNKDVSQQIGEISRRTQLTPDEVREGIDHALAEYQRAGMTIAAKNGVPAERYDAFIAWAQQARPDEALHAGIALVERHDIAGIARLARQYHRTGIKETAYSDEQILSARFGNGITAYKSERGVMLRIPGHGEMSYAAAVRAGIISVR